MNIIIVILIRQCKNVSGVDVSPAECRQNTRTVNASQSCLKSLSVCRASARLRDDSETSKTAARASSRPTKLYNR